MAETILLDSPSGQLSITAPPGYVLGGAEWIEGGVQAHVMASIPADHCQVCGRNDIRLYGRGPINILDAPTGGVRARMLVARQKVECLSCNTFSREPLPHVSAGHRFTDRCAAWMSDQFAWRTNVAIGSVLGLDNKTIRSFAVESGVATRRARYVAPMTECSSCLRLYEVPEIELKHQSPVSRGPPHPAATAFCRTCNADRSSRWIRRA